MIFFLPTSSEDMTKSFKEKDALKDEFYSKYDTHMGKSEVVIPKINN
jgi:hypothetical protein